MKTNIEEKISNEIAQVLLKVENLYLTSEKDELKGEIIVKAKSAWHIEKIEVSLNKREFVSFETNDKIKENNKSLMKNQKFSNESVITVAGQVIVRNTTIKPDQEDFKFGIEIPPENVASFSFNKDIDKNKNKNKFKGKIEYFVKAEVLTADEHSSLVTTSDIEVKSSKNPSEENDLFTKINVKYGCCNAKKGIFNFKIEARDRIIYVFQENQGMCILDNSKSGVAVNRINLSLIESIEGRGKSESGNEKVFTNSELISKWQINGVKANGSDKTPLKIPFPKKMNLDTFTTSRGQFLKKEYKLEVHPEFDICQIFSEKLSALCLLFMSNVKIHTEIE